MTSRTQSSCIEAEKAMKLKVAMNETSTPPKITYFTLPESRPEPPGMATPPLRPPGAVPFLWEEAPGKPKAKRELREVRLPPRPVIKSLQPPPRKVAEMKGAINVTSPTTVLDGPYVLKTSNKSSFQSSSFRFLSGSSNRKGDKYSESNTPSSCSSFSSSSSSSSFSSSYSSCMFYPLSSSSSQVCEDDEVVSEKRKEGKEITEVTISRMMRRNRSLTSMSLHSSSHLWACISGGMKHWPWKRNHKA
ncbi:hypothetical protein IHE45_20G072600 [Dioscorea alata]|uniref:Uncharacterized protein n=1 Tax=Dioscorea alata TaxID=55571 RepID=A0ACB7TT31_DIOAL|nr:hypothetical protein IHE45_20G072600 [Dioscorea alata]